MSCSENSRHPAYTWAAAVEIKVEIKLWRSTWGFISASKQQLMRGNYDFLRISCRLEFNIRIMCGFELSGASLSAEPQPRPASASPAEPQPESKS